MSAITYTYNHIARTITETQEDGTQKNTPFNTLFALNTAVDKLRAKGLRVMSEGFRLNLRPEWLRDNHELPQEQETNASVWMPFT